jgi:hypothetical protein
MAITTIKYRFLQTVVPTSGLLGFSIGTTVLPGKTFTDVNVTADDAGGDHAAYLADLKTIMLASGFAYHSTDPVNSTDAASLSSNSQLYQTVIYTGNGAYSGTTRALSGTNNGADCVNPTTAGFAVTIASGGGSSLLVRLNVSGGMSAAGTDAQSVLVRCGYKTSTAAGAFTAQSMTAGSVQGLGTTNAQWSAAIEWLITGLAPGTYYFYYNVACVTSGTATLPATNGITGGVSLVVQELL